MESKLKKSPKNGSKIFTLQKCLEWRFGKEQVAVVEWKWTPKQLEQLKKEGKFIQRSKLKQKSCLK